MEGRISHRRMAVFLLVGLLTLSAGGGILWAGITGRLTSFGSEQLQELTTQIAAQTDWTQGQFQGTTFDGSVLRLSGTTTNPTTNPTQSAAAQPARTVVESGGFKMAALPASGTSGKCTTYGPTDWTGNGDSTAATAGWKNPAGTMLAGYAAYPVSTSRQKWYQGYGITPGSYYDPSYFSDPEWQGSDPAISARRFAELAILNNFRVTEKANFTNDYNQQIGLYSLRSFQTTTYKGVIFYRTFDSTQINYPVDPTTGMKTDYINVAYIATTKIADWGKEGLLVAQIAGSINCTTQFQPRDQVLVTAASSSSQNKTDQNGSDDGYNPQLGTEYVHDANGTNYLVSPSTNWSSSGPAGAGYYVPKSGGNDYELLQPGRSD